METSQYGNDGQQDLITSDSDEIRQIRMEGYELVVKKARNGLFAAAIIIFLSEIITVFRTSGEFTPLLISFILFEAGIFVALGFLTKKKPYTAILLGLAAFTLIIAFAAVVYGMQQGAAGVIKAIFSGLIAKILIFISLIRPLKDAKELQQLKSNGEFGI